MNRAPTNTQQDAPPPELTYGFFLELAQADD